MNTNQYYKLNRVLNRESRRVEVWSATGGEKYHQAIREKRPEPCIVELELDVESVRKKLEYFSEGLKEKQKGQEESE